MIDHPNSPPLAVEAPSQDEEYLPRYDYREVLLAGGRGGLVRRTQWPDRLYYSLLVKAVGSETSAFTIPGFTGEWIGYRERMSRADAGWFFTASKRERREFIRKMLFKEALLILRLARQVYPEASHARIYDGARVRLYLDTLRQICAGQGFSVYPSAEARDFPVEWDSLFCIIQK